MGDHELLIRRRAALQEGYVTDTVTGEDQISLDEAKRNSLKNLTLEGNTEILP